MSGASVSVVRIVIAGGGNSQNGSLLGLVGDIGLRIAVGHSRKVGFDRTQNTERTIRQNEVMGATAAGRRRSGITRDRSAKADGGGKGYHRVGRTRSGGAAALLGKRAVVNRSRSTAISSSRSSTLFCEKRGGD
jgi:hypothetical protein